MAKKSCLEGGKEDIPKVIIYLRPDLGCIRVLEKYVNLQSKFRVSFNLHTPPPTVGLGQVLLKRPGGHFQGGGELGQTVWGRQ